MRKIKTVLPTLKPEIPLIRNTRLMKSHFYVCNVTPDESMVNILGKANSLPKFLTLEAYL